MLFSSKIVRKLDNIKFEYRWGEQVHNFGSLSASEQVRTHFYLNVLNVYKLFLIL